MFNKIIAVMLAIVVLAGCSNGASAAASSTTSSGNSSSSVAATDTPAAFDAEAVRAQLKGEPYVLVMEVNGLGRGFVEVENPTSFSLSLGCKMRLLDEAGTVITEREQTLQHVRPNSKTLFYLTDDNEVDDPPKAVSVEYEFTSISEAAAHKCPLDNVEITDHLDDHKRIVAEVKNITQDDRVGTVYYIYLSDYDGKLSDWMISELPTFIDVGATKVQDPVRGGNPAESYKSFYFCDIVNRY